MHTQYTAEGASAEMPRYKSHKVVWALKIKEINGNTITPVEPGYPTFMREPEWMEKHKPEIDGYYVVYEDGYASYSPADAFEKGYTAIDTKSAVEPELPWWGTFEHALTYLKSGGMVRRLGWNGKGIFVYLVPGSTFAVNRPPLLGIYPEGTAISYNPHLDIKNADGTVSTWVPSAGDCLANDWVVVD